VGPDLVEYWGKTFELENPLPFKLNKTLVTKDPACHFWVDGLKFEGVLVVNNKAEDLPNYTYTVV
jgi:hypothetical protein